MRFTAFVLMVVVTACGGGSSQQVPVVGKPDGAGGDKPKAPSQSDESAARALADKGDRDTVVQKYPGTAAAAETFLQRARDADAAGRVDEAISNYEKLFYYRPTYEGANAAREPYAKLLLKAGRDADAAKVLESLYRNNGSDPRQGLLLADAFRNGGDGKKAIELLMELKQSPDVRTQAEQKIDATIDGGLSLKDAEALWKDHQNDSAYAAYQPALAFKLAKFYMHVRDYERSAQMARLVGSKFGSTPYAAQASQLLDRLKARSKVNAKTIGAVLPMSGKYRPYGERVAKALELVLTPAGYELIVKDSKADALEAGRAVEELVLKNNVIAVIGDVLSGPAMGAAQKAEELGVPIISLSYAEGIPQVGSYTFRAALTVEAQAKTLVATSMDQMGWTRFALFYPRTAYGIAFTTAFWREVEARKGEIRGAQAYEQDQTTFKEQASKLVGRYYKGTRGDMSRAIQDLREQGLTGPRLQSAIEKAEKNLQPIVDFDAIVIPDGPNNLGLIAPALAYEDVVMEHDPRRLERIRKATGDRNLKPVTLIGGATWNTPAMVEKCEQYCDKSIFVDGFDVNSTDKRVRDFVAAFKSTAGTEPNLLDAQAYDAAGLVKTLLGGGVNDRDALRKALEQQPGYPGVTGVLKFDSEGETDRAPVVLTIEDATIKQWNAPKPQG